MNYWIIKSEPTTYAYSQLEKDGKTVWEGVRNYQARNNLREMQVDDICCFYHSNIGKEIVGLAKVASQSYQDPTTTDPNWLVVDVKPFKTLKKPVSLDVMKGTAGLENMGLIRNGRLSVIKLTKEEFDIIIALSENG